MEEEQRESTSLGGGKRVSKLWYRPQEQPFKICVCCHLNLSHGSLQSLPDTPSQRVQFLLGAEDDDEEHIPHDLFTEMDEICLRDGEDSEWRESAR